MEAPPKKRRSSVPEREVLVQCVELSIEQEVDQSTAAVLNCNSCSTLVNNSPAQTGVKQEPPRKNKGKLKHTVK